MPTLAALASATVESFIAGSILGVVLVALVTVALRSLAPVNAATRAVVWMATLMVLPLICGIYLVAHFSPAPSRTWAVVTTPEPRTSVHQVTPPIISPMAPVRPFSIPAPRNFPADVLALYAVILTLLLTRVLFSYLRLCLLRRRTEPAPAELAARVNYWRQRCPTSRSVELRLSHSAASPLAVGWLRPIIVMPAILVLELSQQDFDDLGVHELAHIRRYDDWTTLLQRLLQAVLFFHPAAHYAARKLGLEREIACDDWVVSAHESKAYARCLAKVVELRRYRRGGLLLSSGAFFGKRQLLKRVETLLDKTRNSATRVSSLTVLAAVVILVGIVSQVAHLPAVIAFTRQESNSTHIRWSDGFREFQIQIRGDVRFSPDEQSITSLSPDGFMSIEQSKGWSDRRIEVRPGASGAPEEKYFLDGRQKPIDGVGRAWVAGAYLFMLREVGLDSEARVTRILSRHGVTGVFEEVDLIHSDQVKRDYLNHLLEQAMLTGSDLQRLADCARKISSDNDKAEFLLAHQREFAAADVRSSYFRAISSIQSDNDRRRVLTGVLEADGQSPETVRLVGLSAKAMNSDNDKAEVLLAVRAAGTGEAGCALLKAASTIQSDNDKSRVLRNAGYLASTACRAEYFRVVNLIQSDNDRAEVLKRLIEERRPDMYRDIAASAKAINSDNDKANVLVLLADLYSEGPLFDAVNTIQSGNDRTRVLTAVLKPTPPKPVLLEVIHSAASLSDNNEETEMLIAVAKQSNDPDVRIAVEQACNKLSSDNDYRRVATALFEAKTVARPVEAGKVESRTR